jgi:hypothetical protein
MRFHRYALVAAWLVVSLVAVAGFANFTTSRQAALDSQAATEVATDAGSDAGAVAAMAFAYLDDGVLRSQPAPAETTTTEAASGTSSRKATTTVVRSSMLGESEVREIVASFFTTDDLPRALRSAWCASTFNPGAVNSSTETAGLFQISLDSWSDLADAAGYGGADILDAEANAAVAAHLVYEVSGSWSNLRCSG